MAPANDSVLEDEKRPIACSIYASPDTRAVQAR